MHICPRNLIRRDISGGQRQTITELLGGIGYLNTVLIKQSFLDKKILDNVVLNNIVKIERWFLLRRSDLGSIALKVSFNRNSAMSLGIHLSFDIFAVYQNIAVYSAVNGTFYNPVTDCVIRKCYLRTFQRIDKIHIIVLSRKSRRSVVINIRNRLIGILIAYPDMLIIISKQYPIAFLPVLSFFQLIVYLERILHKILIYHSRSGSGNTFGDYHMSRRYRCEVKLHMKIRSSAASLHIKDLHGMSCIILKCILAVTV